MGGVGVRHWKSRLKALQKCSWSDFTVCHPFVSCSNYDRLSSVLNFWFLLLLLFFLIVACSVGTSYSQKYSTCTWCSRGTYQDEEGQLRCKPCGEGKTTDEFGADSGDKCFVEKGSRLLHLISFPSVFNLWACT